MRKCWSASEVAAKAGIGGVALLRVVDQAVEAESRTRKAWSDDGGGRFATTTSRQQWLPVNKT
jgi:hypothetical protein